MLFLPLSHPAPGQDWKGGRLHGALAMRHVLGVLYRGWGKSRSCARAGSTKVTRKKVNAFLMVGVGAVGTKK